jgi:NAD(P)-dependent dehydrogenase (short-subunit alcohol dehydrogenase family)
VETATGVQSQLPRRRRTFQERRGRGSNSQGRWSLAGFRNQFRHQSDCLSNIIAADLTTAAGAAALAGQALEILGGLDILVSSAGGQTFRPEGVLAFDDADWEADLAINLMAAVRLDRALVPAMIDAGAGAIVHVSSGAARLPRPASLPYTAAKAALSAYSKGLAVEVGRHGVRVNCVLPGFIPSADHGKRLDARAAAVGMPTEQFLQQVISTIPLGRAGTPEEAAQLIVYLVSPAASFVSGAQILLDGAAFPAL